MIPVPLCKNPACRRPLDVAFVERYGKETCDDTCRAAAWKHETGYGKRRRSNGPSNPSGLQVSYRKAVAAVADVLSAYEEPERCVVLAGAALREALSTRQRERLETRGL